MTDMLDKMASRRSVVAKELQKPGPDKEQLAQILKIGARVPDHGKLEPWRFIVFNGKARGAFGEDVSRIFEKKYPDAGKKRAEGEKKRFKRAPVVICVISSLKKSSKIPNWEQRLSVGAACQNILLACAAHGFSSQWLTEWCAYDKDVNKLLGLKPKEKIAGFIYIGSQDKPAQERARPDMDKIVEIWKK